MAAKSVTVDTSARPSGDFSDFVVDGAAAPNAQQLAKNKLRKANKHENTGSLTLVGDPRLVAGVTLTLVNFGAFDGKYIVEKARHKVGGGYTLQIELRKCLDGY